MTDPARYPWLRLDAELTVRDRIVPTPLFWLVGGGFVLVRDGRVRGWA